MKAFATEPPSLDNEWPDAWALVEVDPTHWMCTLPVHELVELIRTKASDAHLRDLPYAWLGRDLAIEFGPARVVGTADDWLSLCRRLLDSAESTAAVSELPGTRPWSGPTSEVATRSIAVGDSEQPHHRSPVALLAAAGGFDERSSSSSSGRVGCGLRRPTSRTSFGSTTRASSSGEILHSSVRSLPPTAEASRSEFLVDPGPAPVSFGTSSTTRLRSAGTFPTRRSEMPCEVGCAGGVDPSGGVDTAASTWLPNSDSNRASATDAQAPGSASSTEAKQRSPRPGR